MLTANNVIGYIDQAFLEDVVPKRVDVTTHQVNANWCSHKGHAKITWTWQVLSRKCIPNINALCNEIKMDFCNDHLATPATQSNLDVCIGRAGTRGCRCCVSLP